MNVLTIFEQRIGAIFEEGAPGEPRPFSFKRLARRMVREMEDETFVIDGVDTAPALYTVLVAQADDFAMRKLYISITDEISQLIEAQAKKRGYTFVGRPLVRFMVDPALRRGRFSVFAENIDPRTLARLRDEENAYLGVTPTHDVYPEQFSDDSVADVDFQDDLIHSDGLMDAPDDNIAQLEAEAEAQAEASLWDVSTEDEVHEEEVAAPEPDMELDAGIDTGLDTSLDTDLDTGFDEGLDTGFSADVDADGSTDFVPDQDADESMGEEEEDGFTYLPDEAVASCTLTNPDTGETYHITGEHVFIGRGRSEGSVVLRDPNASRRHAELVWDQGGWFVHDLGSTNGTLVNDQECDTERLVDGDMLTIGVTNLVFRAG